MLGKLISEHTALNEQVEMLRFRNETLERRLMSELSTDKLKQLWDSYDGAETCDPAISGEMVHLELNLRGEGAYCAV